MSVEARRGDGGIDLPAMTVCSRNHDRLASGSIFCTSSRPSTLGLLSAFVVALFNSSFAFGMYGRYSDGWSAIPDVRQTLRYVQHIDLLFREWGSRKKARPSAVPSASTDKTSRTRTRSSTCITDFTGFANLQARRRGAACGLAWLFRELWPYWMVEMLMRMSATSSLAEYEACGQFLEQS
jgi:hypothetical protein